MDKASGVYLTITDNSITNSGNNIMRYVIPMLTTRGVLGLNRVTADNFKDIIGYDLEYNSNYYGLSRILENVSYVDVWRLNQNVTMANAYFTDITSDPDSLTDAESFEDVTNIDNLKFAAAAITGGDYGKLCIKFTPKSTSTSFINTNPTTTNPQVITVEDVNENERKIYDGKEILSGIIIYNSTDDTIVGVIVNDVTYNAVTPVGTENPSEEGWYEYNETTKEYSLSEDTTVDNAKTYYEKVEGHTWTVYNAVTPTGTENPVTEGWYEYDSTTGEYVLSEDTTVDDSKTYYEAVEMEGYTCHKVVDGEIQDAVIGVTSFENGVATITLTNSFSKDTFWNFRIIPETITEWEFTVAYYDVLKDVYNINSVYDLSTNSESPDYWKKLKFGPVQIDIKDSSVFANANAKIRDYVMLENGTNGLDQIIPSEIDTTALDTSDANILLMNGITDYKIVNRLANKCELKKIHLHADAPAYTSYIDLQMWAEKIKRSEYVIIGARPDQSVLADGSTIYVYPSVNYATIYSSMYANYGNLNYPPAGPTYGNIAAEDLIKCDYDMYRDELKTNRINWQRSDNVGTMMWEQRTTYAMDSDLSYIAPTFIVDSIAEELVNFERNYNFRYMTPDDLYMQETGINNILTNYVNNGFLYSYEMKFPSYAEAQAAGRTLNILVGIVVMKDSEIINIDLVINNA